MDLPSYPRAEHGRFEQILNQFLLKSVHVILDSRVPASRPPSRSTEVKKSDKWFNLALGDRPAAMESLNFWNRSLMEPVIIDVILVTETQNSLSDHDSPVCLAPELLMETIVERWIVQYESLRSSAPQIVDSSYKKTYKKSIVLLRTVYSMLRLLPAYKAFRKLCSVNRNCHFDINYKVYSFFSPFSREEEQSMKKYSFTPVDAQQGRLSVSVIYLEDLSDFNLDSGISCPPEIITDYVGSPLTPPMKAFSSTSSVKGARATSFPIRVRESTSASPLQRPHSWASGLHRDGYSQQYQAFGGSPPLYRSPYEYSTSPTDIESKRLQTQRFPAYNKSLSDDLLSPPFSLSPSPSPPAYLSAGNPTHSRMHSETAPVSIPHPMMSRSPRYLSPNLSDSSSRHSLPPLSPRNTKYDPSPHGSPSGIKSIKKQDSLRAGELYCGPINLSQKISRDAKEDSGRFSSLQSSNSSPRFGFSRSSSRLSFQDDFGDCDFSCPFIVDDVDSTDFQTSQNLDGANVSEVTSQPSSTVKKSQDAAVGALVHMLKTAPPLRQDSSHYTSYSSELQPEKEVTVSDFFKPRKTSDALEELNVYREMKDVLLSRSAARIAGREKTGT